MGYKDAKSDWVPFKVDYRLSKEQVFVEVTKAIICATKSLEVLRFAGKRIDGGNGLPSWVPDWANKEPHLVSDYTPIVFIQSKARESWRADRKGSDTAIRWCPIREQITWYCLPSFSLGNKDTLTIRGIHFDTITAVSKHAWPHREDVYSIDFNNMNHETGDKALNIMEHYLESHHEWIDDCQQKAMKYSPYPTSESTSDALWSTLNGEAAREEMPGTLSCDQHLSNIRDVRSTLAILKGKHHFMRSNAIDPLSEVALGAAVSRVEGILSSPSRMATVCLSKKFAVTRKKYMGLVPQKARVGDLICVMYGCETPFTLRRRGRKAFELLGQCSVQGLNYDSAVAESRFRRGQPELENSSGFWTFDASRRSVYTTLKRTKYFTLV